MGAQPAPRGPLSRDRLPALARLLWTDWDEAPPETAFEAPWGEILGEAAASFRRLSPEVGTVLADPRSASPAFREAALALFVRLPAIINVVLNWRICLEQGLPLHPTEYFEVNETTRNRVAWPPEAVAPALSLFRISIAAARALLRLDPEGPRLLDELRAGMDPAVLGFVFTSVPDKYTWRACDPAKILALAGRVEGDGDFAREEGLVVGAAHGSLVPGLILAETLGWELWFLRFSMFKRHDREPVISPSDLEALAGYRERPVLLFDEDVAKGTTLRIFTERLAPLFPRARSASVIRHGLAAFRPDYWGVQWF